LAKYYLGEPVLADGGWALKLPDETLILWKRPASLQMPDAGSPPLLMSMESSRRYDACGMPQPLSQPGKLCGPTGDDEVDDARELQVLQDLFQPPYVKGPITEVMGDENVDDPGRTRLTALFFATYGKNLREVAERLAKVRFMGVRYPFHERAKEALERVAQRLEEEAKANPKLMQFLTHIGGTWHWRRIARTKILSSHAFGIAIDLNVDKSHYWRWQRPKKPLKWKNRFPQAIVDAFEAEGFIWGGRWIHYDTMHFEYRPELLDSSCYRP
jgi:hypothetical protein